MAMGYVVAIGLVLVSGCTTVAGLGSEYVLAEQGPRCDDGITNGDEVGVDCGGGCNLCADGQTCVGDVDCASGVCSSFFCQVPTCTDAMKNGDESDVDCGGSCGTTCAISQGCAVDADCASGTCGYPDMSSMANVCTGVQCGCAEYLTSPADCPGGLDDDSAPLYDDLFACYCGTAATPGPCAMDCSTTSCADPSEPPDSACGNCAASANMNVCKAQFEACANDL